MSNKELAVAVSDETGDSVEHIEAVIRVHQQRFPASWQEWTVAGSADVAELGASALGVDVSETLNVARL